MNDYTTANGKAARLELGPGVSVFKRVATADTNAAVVKASAGVVYGIFVNNINAAARYLKLYNKATAPTVGTDVPVMVIPIAPGQVVYISIQAGVAFSTGIGIGLVSGLADNSTGAVTASEHVVSIVYL